MTPMEAVGLVSGVASIVGLILAVLYARREAAKVKDLRYDTAVSRFPLVSSTALKGYGVSISYGSGSDVERIENLYVHHVVMLNRGKESIRGTDMAPGNPLRVEVQGTRVLDIRLKSATRDVINFSVAGPTQGSNGATVAKVNFDYLDHEDGGLVRILTTSPPDSISVAGDIVGMPKGIRAVGEDKRANMWARAGGVGSLLLFGASLLFAVLAYRWTTGAWEYVWVLALPILALIVPLAIITLVATTIWPSGDPPIPPAIAPGRRLKSPHGALLFEEASMFAMMASTESVTVVEKSTEKSPGGEGSTTSRGP